MVINTVGHLAEAAFYHPDLAVPFAFVIVKLRIPSVDGITDKDFALARKMEEVVQWPSGQEVGSPLLATPARGVGGPVHTGAG